jgi:hypothetical protein
MPSESARMSSAAEARFRVQAPNSKPRAMTVVALDGAGEAAVRRLAASGRTRATFLTAVGELRDLTGAPKSLVREVDAADLVVFLAGPGGHARNAAIIGRACSDRRVMTHTVIVRAAAVSDEAISRTLLQVRPWSLMVVVVNDDDYVDDILKSFR